MQFIIRGQKVSAQSLDCAQLVNVGMAQYEANCSGNNPVLTPLLQVKFLVSSGSGEWVFDNDSDAQIEYNARLSMGEAVSFSTIHEEIK